jgi:predicted PhzF superfamily epimerase YddE/YHI9
MEVIHVKPSKTLVERIKSQFPEQETSQFAEELDVADSVAEVWPEPPDTKHLHIIVGLPSDHAASRLLPDSECFIRLFALVQDI